MVAPSHLLQISVSSTTQTIDPRAGARSAIVTGGSTGIGAAIVARLAADGAAVHVIDTVPPTMPDVSSTRADISDEAAVRVAVAEAVSVMGGVDTLVNNVGIAGQTSSVEDVDIADLRRVLDVNIAGTVLVTKLTTSHMARGASVINIVSSAGLMGYPRRSAYAASKWAIVGLTKTWAMELGPRGIRVNAVAPGSVEGDRIDRVIAAEAEVTDRSPGDVRQDYEGQTSMGVFVESEEIAGAVVFLAGPDAINVSGQVLSVDGHTETLRI